VTQKRIFSLAYYFTVGTNNAVKCNIISAVMWLDYLQPSVFISINKTQMKLEPPPKWSSPKRHPNFRIRSGKIMTSQSSQYLFGLCVLFLLFFKPWFCNGPETELKGKIGIRENILLVFYHIKTVGA